MTKIDITIGLRVSVLFVCEIAVHVVSISPGHCAFVDYECLDDRSYHTSTTTEESTDSTTSCRDFRDDVVRRDGPACVVTKMEEYICDAVHLIPHSKGDEVRFVVSSYNYLMTSYSSTFKK
jgi:hypothetical protein